MTYRYYLQDMAFAVALQGPQQDLDTVYLALQNPVWDLYLGRKNCVPTELIGQGIFATLEEALHHADQLASHELRQNKLVSAFHVTQGAYEEGEIITVNDVPIQFGTKKLYRDRRVTIIRHD